MPGAAMLLSYWVKLQQNQCCQLSWKQSLELEGKELIKSPPTIQGFVAEHMILCSLKFLFRESSIPENVGACFRVGSSMSAFYA